MSSSRFRGSGRRYFNDQPWRPGRGGSETRPRVDITLPKPLIEQKLVDRISLGTVRALSGKPEGSESSRQVGIQNAEYVASYNWVDKKEDEPTILVPGAPPKWQLPEEKRNLPEDGGQYFRDPNSARFPSYPVEPAIRALLQLKPDFDTDQVDLFACGSTLACLLAFVSNEDFTFRFGVESIGQTIFLVRKTKTPKELIENVRGFGHTFPEEYTTWDKEVRGSASHQRVIQYDLGSLNCLLRSESDGFLPDKLPQSSKLTSGSKKHKEGNKAIMSMYDEMLNAQFFSPPAYPHDVRSSNNNNEKSFLKANKSGLTIKDKGDLIPQAAIFELKTRSGRHKIEPGRHLEEQLPRIWANQTPNLILAYHDGYGYFKDIHIIDTRDHIKTWEQTHQSQLQKLEALIVKLKKHKAMARTKLEIRRTGTGPLELWTEAKGWSALPIDLKRRWMKDQDYPSSSSSSAEDEGLDEKKLDMLAFDFGRDDDDDLESSSDEETAYLKIR